MSRTTESEERLLIEAAQKDPSRFGELYELNFYRVYAYVARRVRDRPEAQDLTAHVFQQALTNIAKFKWRGAPFSTWLYRIAANAIADQARRRSLEADHNNSLAPESASPIDLEKVERSAGVYRAVEQLPEDQRRVVVMRFAEEKSIREIALELKRTEGAIKQLQFRGLETLRARLKQK